MQNRYLAAFAVLSLVLAIVAPLSAAGAAEQARRYELERADKGYRLALRSVELPAPKANEVVVRIRAVSLNHRDLYVLAAKQRETCRCRTALARSWRSGRV
jgi:hypothetical protein